VIEELLADHKPSVEEVTVPSRPLPLEVGTLGRSVEWLLVAIRDGAQWRFNPPDDATVSAGQALVVIASAAGRRELEARVAS
jgi:uncharacterized protein with PhoU and TrkA domain